MNGDGVPPVTLHVAAVPASLPVIRAVVAAMAAAADLTLDDIDDATIAVEEAALMLLDHGSSELTVTVLADESVLRVSVRSDGDVAGWPSEGFRDGLSGRILRGVVDEVTASVEAPGVEFAKASAAR